MSIESKKVVLYTKDEGQKQLLTDLFQKLELIDNFFPDSLEKCIEDLKDDKNILILDWNVGLADCVKLLAYISDNFYLTTDKTTVFLYGTEAVTGVLTEYGITHSCFGEFSIDNMEKVLREIVESSVIDQEVSLELADILLSGDTQDQDKIEKMEEMYKKYTFNPNVCISLAILYMRVGDYSKVNPLLSSLIVHEDQSIRELNMIGLSFFKDGKSQEALDYLQRANEYNPYNLSRLEALTNLYLATQQYDAAVPIFELLKKIDPQNPSLLSGEGRVSLLTEDVNEVCAKLEQSLSSEQMVSMINEVAIYLVKGKNPMQNEARILSLYYRACRYCINNKEQLAKICFNLALAYYKLEDMAKAHYFFTIASMIENSYGKAISNAALLQLKLKPDQLIPVDGTDIVKSIFKFAS